MNRVTETWTIQMVTNAGDVSAIETFINQKTKESADNADYQRE